jgi:GMP synthase-like glutamine amidotransferase
MNNGHPNQAIRCFKRLLTAFTARAVEANPGLQVSLAHVQPRNLDELPPKDSDITLSSGGPGSPYEGYEDPWCVGWRNFIDHVLNQNLKQPVGGPAMLNVCHSFEIASHHLGVATLQPRDKRKFGIMPVYPTEHGQVSDLFQGFGDRLFAFEHRSWEVVDLNEKRVAQLGGALLARESRDGQSKGRGLVAFRFGPGVEGTIFHPEADREGVMAWIDKPEMAAAFKDAYGDETYEQMMDTLNDPSRVARTFKLFIPTFLTQRFNALAASRGWRTLPPPSEDDSGLDL